MTEDEAVQIEQATRQQRRSPIWMLERSKRITSSHFGEICRATDKKDLKALTRRLMHGYDACGPAIEHGIKYEDSAALWFDEHYGMQTSECGLFVYPEMPFLAASPDRVIDSSQLLEIKCPYSAKDMLINSKTVPYLREVNGELALSPTHAYFYQVQGQLMCAKRDVCHFVVFTFKDKQVIKISRDEEFIEEMKVKLHAFFEDHFKTTYLDEVFFKGYGNFHFTY